MKKLSLLVVLFICLTSCGRMQKEKKDVVREPSEQNINQVPEDPIDADTIQVGNVERTVEEWKSLLTAEEFNILREAGTEPPFSNAYHNFVEEGIYYCGGCQLALYSSNTKFYSETGWPSFWAPIDPKLVKRELDERFGMVRTEVICAQCDSHLGHIFEYPGVPTGERHCLNSLALDFKPRDL